MLRNTQSGWIYPALAVGVVVAVLVSGLAHYFSAGELPFPIVFMLLLGVLAIGGGVVAMNQGKKARQAKNLVAPEPFDPAQPLVRQTAESIPDHLQPRVPTTLPPSSGAQPVARDARYDALLPEGYDPTRALGEQTAFFRAQGKFEEAPKKDETPAQGTPKRHPLQDDSSASPISFDNL